MEATLDPKQLQRFRDPVWRISNLYAIRTRDGKVVPFRPRPQQLQVLQMIYRQGLKRIVILKARQLGFSTLLGIAAAAARRSTGPSRSITNGCWPPAAPLGSPH